MSYFSPWESHLPVMTKVNRTFFDHRSLEHEVGSLEAVVSKLIKNWDPWFLMVFFV